MKSPVVAAVDVGGTKIAGGLVATDGSVHSLRRVASGDSPLGDPNLSLTLAMATDLVNEAGPSIAGLGVGVPEVVTPGGMLTTREVIGWNEQPLTLLAGLASPTVIESDVRCGALAEAWFGSGAALTDFLYVSVGTGLSHTHMVNRTPRTGSTGAAIWMGALPVANRLPGANDPELELERYASGRAIARRYSLLAGRSVTTREVFDAAEAGDVDAALVIDSAGSALGAAIGHMVLVLDPEAVVVGGGMTDAPSSYWEPAWRSLTETLRHRRTAPTRVFKAAGGQAVGVLGAACGVFVTSGIALPGAVPSPDPWVTVG